MIIYFIKQTMARNIFSRQVYKLVNERWLPMDYAKRLAYKQQLANGNIFPNSYRLTDKWKEYSNLFSEKRAVIRKERAKWNRLARKQGILDWMIN